MQLNIRHCCSYDGPPPASAPAKGKQSASTASGPSVTNTPLSSSDSPSPSWGPDVSGASSQGSSVPVKAIAGGVVGGVLVLLFAVLAIWYWRRRRSRQSKIDAIQSRRKSAFDIEDPEQDLPPPPVPFTAGLSSRTSEGSPTTREALLPNMDGSARSSAYVSSISLLSGPTSWPSSADGKRALHEASIQRVQEMEQRIAGQDAPMDSAERQRMDHEIEELKAQVEQLSTALRVQTEMQGASAYEEPPPSYDAGLARARSTAASLSAGRT